MARFTKNKTPPKATNTQKAKKPAIQKLTSILRKEVKRKSQMKPKNEFRFNHDTGHMNHVFLGSETEYRSVGFTTHEKTFGRSNMPLTKNPKDGDTRPSFVRNGIIADNKKSYASKPAKNYCLSPIDRANVKSKERNYKTQQKRKKAQKK